MRIEKHFLSGDGWVPNHPSYPLLHYKSVPIHGMLLGTPSENSQVVLAHFAKNGWVEGWVNGIFPFQHYHSTAHEVLANVADPVDVQFGGRHGPVFSFETGDVILIPAGIGHCRRSSPANLVIVGAYPAGQDWDLKRDTTSEYSSAQRAIMNVPRPKLDPVTGLGAPLDAYWLD